MKIEIKFNTDNAAFDDFGNEVARILRDLAYKVEDCENRCDFYYTLRDMNGNMVGSAKSSEEETLEKEDGSV